MRGVSFGSKKALVFELVAAGTAVIDQVSKVIARHAMQPGQSVTVIPGVLDLRLSYNSGGAFGVGSGWAPLFIIIAVAALFAIVKLRSVGPDSKALAVGLGLLMGGALGNLIDRLTSSEHLVTDFIDFHVWPVFNLADCAIVVGAVLTFFHVYILQKRGQDDGH